VRWLLRQCNAKLEAFLPYSGSAVRLQFCVVKGLKRQAAIALHYVFYGPPHMELDWAYHMIRPGKEKKYKIVFLTFKTS